MSTNNPTTICPTTPSTINLVPVALILAYRHMGVIRRLMKEEGWDQAKAEQVFAELMKFLVVSALTSGSHSPSRAVDKAWHALILFTQDYRKLCHTSLGFFLDHQPADFSRPGERKRMIAAYRGTIQSMIDLGLQPDPHTLAGQGQVYLLQRGRRLC